MPIRENSEAQRDRLFAVDVTASLFGMEGVLPRMHASQSGRILEILLLGSQDVIHSLAVFISSKGALDLLTRAMAFELALWNIRENAISPGISTPPISSSGPLPISSARSGFVCALRRGG